MAAERVAATFVAVRTCRKIPVSRHPPIKLEQKVALCAANKIGRPLPGEMLLRGKLPAFTSSLFALYSELRLRCPLSILVFKFR